MISSMIKILKGMTDCGFIVCFPFIVYLTFMVPIVPISHMVAIICCWGISALVWFSVGRKSLDNLTNALDKI